MIFSDLTIGKKISGGFVITLVLLIVITAMSLFGFNSIVKNASEVISGNRLDGNLAQKEVDHLNWVNKVNTLLTDDTKHTLDVQTDDHKCGFGKWLYGEGRKEAEQLVPELASLLKAIEKPHLSLHQSAIEIGKNYREVDTELGRFLSEKKIDHLLWTHKIKDALLNESDKLGIQLDPTKCGLGKWIYSDKTQQVKTADPEFSAILDTMIPFHEKLHSSARQIETHLAESNFKSAHAYYTENTMIHAEDTLKTIDEAIEWHSGMMQGLQQANRVYAEMTIPALASIQTLLKQIRETGRENIMADVVMLDAAQRSTVSVVIMSSIAIIAGIIFSIFIARHITGLLKLITTNISEGSQQVDAAANQIASSSQSLAESASSQAATVEETSASVQQIAAHGNQTSEMTKGAEELMNANIEKSGQSLRAIVEITSKINQIVADSDKIGAIIKSIDQIAFQTNLLALNAAVEAARAGEAGAGFAVVADEVRNLAIRSTEAAKDTQELLDGTITSIEQISSAINEMNDNFEGIVESATVIGEKTAGITAASIELAKGIDQISEATHAMDGVTQQMASNSEESSAAAEELSAQAQELAGIVDELNRMVYGARIDTRTAYQLEEPLEIDEGSSLPEPEKKLLAADSAV